jgi:signal peptidase I
MAALGRSREPPFMTADAKIAPSSKSGGANEWVEIVKTIIYALLIALALRVLLFQPFTIPSASMEPNLFEGDYVIVSKFDYGYSRHSIPLSPPLFSGRILARPPTRGDVIVFKLPRDTTFKTDYIKRLIGLPGDRIQVRQGLVYINDKPIIRQPMPSGTEDMDDGTIRQVQRYQETLPNGVTYLTNSYGNDNEADNTGVYVVPEGQYFMMGDNRDNSSDSRFPTEVGVGYVPAENLEGRAEMVLLSWKPGASLLKPWTWLNIRTSRFFHLLR